MKTLVCCFAILFGQPATMRRPTAEPLQATVRILIASKHYVTYSSGTVIASDGRESVVLGCAHAFWKHDEKPTVTIDLFDGEPHGQYQQSAKIATHRVTRYRFDDSLDLALFWIKPGTELPRAKLAARLWVGEVGDKMRVAGCRLGADPNTYRCEIQVPMTRSEVITSEFWRGTQCTWSATFGRSGGGLFDANGLLCGVLNRCSGTDNDTVPPPWSCSTFANPATIFRFLDANGLGWLDGTTPKTAAP